MSQAKNLFSFFIYVNLFMWHILSIGFHIHLFITRYFAFTLAHLFIIQHAQNMRIISLCLIISNLSDVWLLMQVLHGHPADVSSSLPQVLPLLCSARKNYLKNPPNDLFSKLSTLVCGCLCTRLFDGVCVHTGFVPGPRRLLYQTRCCSDRWELQGDWREKAPYISGTFTQKYSPNTTIEPLLNTCSTRILLNLISSHDTCCIHAIIPDKQTNK